tara:strand:+ start:216 stop:578 length:363 start_codon:yes stop_codon:yes gene_type:complete
MKTDRLKNPMGINDDARDEHLSTILVDWIEALSKRDTDPMEHIRNADDIHYTTASDGRTFIGAKLRFDMPHGITLMHDTYEEIIEAQWESRVAGLNYNALGTDLTAYEMAASDMFWAVRS